MGRPFSGKLEKDPQKMIFRQGDLCDGAGKKRERNKWARRKSAAGRNIYQASTERKV